MAITSKVLKEKYDPTATAFSFVAGADLSAGNALSISPNDGLVYNVVDGYTIVGVSNVDVAKGETVKVQTGTWEFPTESDVSAYDVGKPAYFVIGSGTVSAESSGNELGGTIVAVERSGWAFVHITYPL